MDCFQERKQIIRDQMARETFSNLEHRNLINKLLRLQDLKYQIEGFEFGAVIYLFLSPLAFFLIFQTK